MTSSALFACIIPPLPACAAGARANETNGASTAGGMFFGTSMAVRVVPGLNDVYGGLASRSPKLLRDEYDTPLREVAE